MFTLCSDGWSDWVKIVCKIPCAKALQEYRPELPGMLLLTQCMGVGWVVYTTYW